MGEYKHRLTLQAFHDNADLSELPTTLGHMPSKLARVGDERFAPNGRKTGGRYRFSTCTVDFDPKAGESLPQNLSAIVARLKPHQEYLQALVASGVRLQFFVGWFNSDLNSRDVFTWDLLRDLADLRISLDIDFYGPNEDEESK